MSTCDGKGGRVDGKGARAERLLLEKPGSGDSIPDPISGPIPDPIEPGPISVTEAPGTSVLGGMVVVVMEISVEDTMETGVEKTSNPAVEVGAVETTVA